MRKKKLAAKGHAILKSKEVTRLPPFNVMDYKGSMVRALNYYSSQVDNKIKKKYALQYWKRQGKDVSVLSSVHDSWFGTVGAVAHMAMNDIPLEDFDLERLNSAYIQLIGSGQKEIIESSESAKLGIQDHISNAAKVHIAEFEHMIDLVGIMKQTDVDPKQYITSNEIKGPILKKISEWAKDKIKELNQVLDLFDDRETLVAEGYRNLGKNGIKRILNLLNDINDSSLTIATIARTQRLPRKRKEKPPIVLAAKMKIFKGEIPELNLKSLFPEKIVGADQVFLFDKNKRRIIKYTAMDGYTLTIRTSTIMNFDPEKSFSKICRRPVEQLQDIQKLGKRAIQNLYDGINSIEGKVSGRTNEGQMIINVY